MTFTGLFRRFKRPAALAQPAHDLMIGGVADRTIACPSCARPLAYGQGRCPGCGSRLVAGVLVRTALLLILVGGIVGMVAGAMVTGMALGPRVAGSDGSSAAAATGAPGAAGPTATAVATPVATIPSGYSAGLVQVAAVNDRLARASAKLATVLGARGSGAAEIAPVLRKIAADVGTGDDAVRRLAAWGPAGPLVADVAKLYGAAASVATDGLGAPLTDDAAYVAAGRRMRVALKPLSAVDTATHAIAAEAGITLPAPVPAP